MGMWQQAGGVSRGGDVGGDIQATESYSVRYIHEYLPAVVDVVFYGVDQGDGKGFAVEVQTVMTVCLDVQDPGGTEAWCDATYSNGSTGYRTAFAAERAALAAAVRHRPSEITWNGLAPRERR